MGLDRSQFLLGTFAWSLHMRLRWSDGQYCQHEPVTDLHNGKGFLECQLYHHKNAGRQKHAKRLLPAACNLPGLSGFDWASSWLQLRGEQSLTAGPGVQPCRPRWQLVDGPWSPWSLVRLQHGCERSSTTLSRCHHWTDIGTHSLKATWLSMMAKAGCEGDLRRFSWIPHRSWVKDGTGVQS